MCIDHDESENKIGWKNIITYPVLLFQLRKIK